MRAFFILKDLKMYDKIAKGAYRYGKKYIKRKLDQQKST